MRDHPYPLPGWLQHLVERNIGRPPLWRFPEMPRFQTLTFERLHFDNRQHVLDMFARDSDPFVSSDFKLADRLYNFVAAQWICGPYSPKRGCADWLVWTEQKNPAGLLHVYDVSRETWALNHRRCSIGYAVAEPYRGTGLAQVAVTALQEYLFDRLDMLMLLAMPEKRNERSARFLRSLGYLDTSEKYDDDNLRFFELYRDEGARAVVRDRFAPEIRAHEKWTGGGALSIMRAADDDQDRVE